MVDPYTIGGEISEEVMNGIPVLLARVLEHLGSELVRPGHKAASAHISGFLRLEIPRSLSYTIWLYAVIYLYSVARIIGQKGSLEAGNEKPRSAPPHCCPAFALVCIGCSAVSNPVTPASGGLASASKPAVDQVHLWGYYDVYVDIPSQTAFAVLNRSMMFEANVGELRKQSFNKPYLQDQRNPDRRQLC